MISSHCGSVEVVYGVIACYNFYILIKSLQMYKFFLYLCYDKLKTMQLTTYLPLLSFKRKYKLGNVLIF